jgi:hypothetical protein
MVSPSQKKLPANPVDLRAKRLSESVIKPRGNKAVG